MPGMIATKKRPIPGFASGTANVQQPFTLSDILGPAVATPADASQPTITPMPAANSQSALTAALAAGSRMPSPAPALAPAPVAPQGGFGGADLAAATAPAAPAIPAYAPAASIARWGAGAPGAGPLPVAQPAAQPAAPPVVPGGNTIRWASRAGTPGAVPAPNQGWAPGTITAGAGPRFSTQDAQYMAQFVPRQPMPQEIAQRDLIASATSERDEAMHQAQLLAATKPGYENQPQNEPGYMATRQALISRYLSRLVPILNPLAALYPNGVGSGMPPP